MVTSDTYLARHFLATLAYRFQKTLLDAPPSFASLRLGHGVRIPQQIVRHMNGVLSYGLAVVKANDANHRSASQDLSWEGEVGRFYDLLEALGTEVSRGTLTPELLSRLLQGPLADAMTHIGQLALLRRIAGSPVQPENFFSVDIHLGQIRPYQLSLNDTDP